MKYRDYSAEEFANDSFFIRWVQRPDTESDWFWTSFVRENPKSQPQVEKAREMIAMLDYERHPLEEAEVKSMRDSLLMSLRAEIEHNRESMPLQAFISSREVLNHRSRLPSAPIKQRSELTPQVRSRYCFSVMVQKYG